MMKKSFVVACLLASAQCQTDADVATAKSNEKVTIDTIELGIYSAIITLFELISDASGVVTDIYRLRVNLFLAEDVAEPSVAQEYLAQLNLNSLKKKLASLAADEDVYVEEFETLRANIAELREGEIDENYEKILELQKKSLQEIDSALTNLAASVDVLQANIDDFALFQEELAETEQYLLEFINGVINKIFSLRVLILESGNTDLEIIALPLIDNFIGREGLFRIRGNFSQVEDLDWDLGNFIYRG